jgi:spore coat protein H
MKGTLILAVCLNICAFGYSQEAGLCLDLPAELSHESKNLYSFKVSSYIDSRIKEISGEKFKIPSCEIAYNGIPLAVKTCKIRGHTTLYFKRKSFSISLKDPILLGECEIEKLALNSLSMDCNYYRNRLSFLLMEKIGIFPLQNAYAELCINGNSAGLYLAIQKPEDYIRSLGSNLLVRREYEGRLTTEYSEGENAKNQIKRLKKLRKLTKELEGQQLYDSLNAVVFLDHYFKWLAFNYLIKNGDYTDELFLYLTVDENRFDIIPWDYDDIFKSQPHDGFERRNKVLDHKLLFSGEAYIDIVIDQDKFLYQEFLLNFQQVLEILTPELLQDVFETVYTELYPYFTDEELISQSDSDFYGLTNLSDLRVDLQNQFRATLYQRQSIESIIKSELRRLLD